MSFLKSILLIVLVALPPFVQGVNACTCGSWYDSFCETVVRTEGSWLKPELVVQGVKLSDYMHGMKFEITDVVYGNHALEEIMVWGDPGNLCRLYTSQFNDDDTMIISINSQVGWDPVEQQGDFQLPGCGIYYLSFSNGLVAGNISPIDSIMSYTEFKTYMQSAINADTCVMTSAVKTAKNINLIMYPNPSDGTFKIEIDNFNGEVDLRVFDLRGRQMRELRVSQEQSDFDISGLADGVYVVELSSGSKVYRDKLLIH